MIVMPPSDIQNSTSYVYHTIEKCNKKIFKYE
jgi:hypothetical protein